MIHTKLLIRRLAYVPWLLAFGLVLGWAGEAQAQDIRLTVDKESLREDGGAQTITVTATNYNEAGATGVKTKVTDSAKIVLVTTSDNATDGGGLNVNYTVTQAAITIAKDADAGSAEITITPIVLNSPSDAAGADVAGDNMGANADFTITIDGTAGNFDTDIETVALVEFIDTHKVSTTITLSFDPPEISQEAGPTEVTVTGTLNGETITRKNLTFPLIVVGADVFTGTDPFPAVPTGTVGVRDTDYRITDLGNLTIPRKKDSGTATFTVDPSKGPRWVGIGTTVAVNTPTPASTPRDAGALYYDGLHPADDAGTTDTDESLDGDADGDGTNDTKEEQQLQVIPGSFTISEAKVAELAAAGDGGLTASPAAVREADGKDGVEIELKVVLKNPLPEAQGEQSVNFTIVEAIRDGGGAVERDIDYRIEFDALSLKPGEKEGTTTALLTTIDDTAGKGNIVITVNANVARSDVSTTITITDDDLLTENITLKAEPAEVSEDAGLTEVEITATIDGATFDEDLKLTLVLEGGGADRDVDYTATLRSLTIPMGEVSGSKTIDIIPIDDGVAEKTDDETILVTVLGVNADGVGDGFKNDDDDPITIKKATIKLGDTGEKAEPEDPSDTTPVFSEEDALASATAIEGVVGTAIEQVLPEATGDGDLSYSVSSNLPAGLSFDPATRTLSGTPTAAGNTGIVYTVVDGDEGDAMPAESAVLTYNIEIEEAPEPMASVASLNVSRLSVREDDVATEITLTAKLAEAAPVAGEVRFTLQGGTAIRDVDYTAVISSGTVAIAEGDTEAQTTLTLTPVDNESEDGNRIVGLRASISGSSASAEVTIADDETASTSISLSASPHAFSEAAEGGQARGQITASLNGKVLDADATVIVTVDDGASTATRDLDYNISFSPELTIPAGQVSGSIPFLLVLRADDEEEGSETIELNGAIDDFTDGTGTITINDAEAMMDDDMMMDPLMFAEGTMLDAIEATAGTAIEDVVLPEAAGGEGDITYSVSDNLPAGLLFDAETRTLSGTPEAATDGAVEVTYTATAGEETTTLTLSITVNAALEFDLSDFLGAFNGAGKANPADEHIAEGAIPIVVGQPYSLTLPEVSGGTPPHTYSVTGLPAGLSFDPATRTVSGTPTEVGDAVVVTYSVTDASGASNALPLLVQVINPPLGAPTNLVVEDYKGADGQGDQGGFVLVTWELSEHHDGIDGYRIFRALPVLDNEMVPWAMVDAVPGVDRGVAVVATLDNVATHWGIAAERSGQTTHGAAKAVFVSADNMNQSYEQMAETLMASMAAAQAGDAPVFASLLPEALAYAQGVAPRLNLVEGVLTSAITATDEPVRAIDDIAPLAVPSLSVLDAPNDQGSRIALTWTLSPSDQVLQDVLAGAIGPLGTEPVVGVYGYNIYRRAASEDEFAKIGQVDAGVASFVDETALNGVHYTYQVRPYDLDNETGSDLEQTAMAVRNLVLDSDGNAIYGLFGADNRIGFDDFFIFADNFGLTAADAGFDPAFDLAPSEAIDFDDFFVFADNFGRSIAAAGKRVPMLAGLNTDARMYLDARTALPNVGEDFVLDVRLADFAAIKGYGLQVQYEADKLEFVEVLTDQPLGGSALATPQVLADQAGVLTVAAHGDVVSDGEVALSLVFRPTTEIENTVIEIADNQTYDSEFGFNRLALPAPVQVQTRPEVFSLANNYPNPFNPATTIKYALPQAANVELTVYNVLGQPVRTLIAEHQNAGRYVVEWDATNDNGHSLSSGMYFYRLEAGGEFLEVKKMLLLK